ncbi:MAG: hypothetical protein U9Q66_02895 [Patescibacteria group bacterium]|nr:hypothetical protein [Patescibacteria group bacterium]
MAHVAATLAQANVAATIHHPIGIIDRAIIAQYSTLLLTVSSDKVKAHTHTILAYKFTFGLFSKFLSFSIFITNKDSSITFIAEVNDADSIREFANLSISAGVLVLPKEAKYFFE